MKMKPLVKGRWLVRTKKLTKENILYWTQNSTKVESSDSGLSLAESEKSENIQIDAPLGIPEDYSLDTPDFSNTKDLIESEYMVNSHHTIKYSDNLRFMH